MEHLLELLNSYNLYKENWFVVDDWGWEYLEYDEEKEPMLIYKSSGTTASGEDAEAIMISKSYWFIQWLCKQEKLEPKEAYRKLILEQIKEGEEYRAYIQWLSLADDPVRLLLSMIK